MRSDGLKNWDVLSRDEKSEIKMLIDIGNKQIK